jgi:hypothetical protein
MNILFLNHKIHACGVYQYGLRVADILKKSNKNNYIYSEIENYHEYLNCLSFHNPDIIIYNYHTSTMSWLNSQNIQYEVTNIGIPHESSCDFFDYIFNIDPSETDVNNIYSIPRPIYENIEELFTTYKITDNEIDKFINYNEGPDVPIFGSFGFGFQNKGFDKIIDIINQNYTKAIIKLVITIAHFDPNNITNYNIISNLCKLKNINPNIKLLICNNFFTNEEILLFLHSNTANIFLYDQMIGRGMSSVIDYAISANKPFVISDSYMFKHVYSDSICVYKTNIKDAIINSASKSLHLIYKYSNKNLIDKIDKTIYFIRNVEINFKQTLSCYYYNENNKYEGNVTNILFKLYIKYKYQQIDTFSASNATFGYTFFGTIKKLYINIHNNNDSPLVFTENEIIYWNDIDKYIIFDNADNINNQIVNNLIEVSIGEIIDKYSILEIKIKYIKNYNKIKEIKKEMNVLEKFVKNIKNSYFYKLLLFINEQIWLDTDTIKYLTYIDNNYKFAQISNNIFENNQKRFRLKKYFNILNNSNIIECKSYFENKCYIIVNSEKDIYDKIPEINYLVISYDVICFKVIYKNIIEKLFKNPNIQFITEENSVILSCDLTNYNLDNNIKDIFEFDTIKYKSGGKFGDYLNQLSVVCENFYKTGKKGELFITDLTNIDDKFLFGLEHTYNDTYTIFCSQKYIKTYKIYNNEHVDIDLSLWRFKSYYFVHLKYNWFHIYNYIYNVNWGSHQWLSSVNYAKWNDKIIINITPFRFMSFHAINLLFEKIHNHLKNCVFISNEKEHYDYFLNQTNFKIEFYHPKNFEETVSIINSCKIGFFGFSSFAVIANALHKHHYLLGVDGWDFNLNNLKSTMPHILDILI